MTTLGEYRVGITFNPGGNPLVDKIKRACADLIDLIHDMQADPNGEVAWLKDKAMRQVEAAAMNAVKAATKPPRPVPVDEAPHAEI